MERKQVEPYISKYLHSKGRRLGLPIGGNFELTARCNFNCPMCYVHLSAADVEAQGKELTAQQWIDIAREARDAGMVFVLLTSMTAPVFAAESGTANMTISADKETVAP